MVRFFKTTPRPSLERRGRLLDFFVKLFYNTLLAGNGSSHKQASNVATKVEPLGAPRRSAMSGQRASLGQAAQILKLVQDTGWSRTEVDRRFIGHFGLLRQIAEALDDPHLTEEQVRAMHPLFYKKGETVEIAEFFAPVSDKDLPEELRETAAKWRKLAAELGYSRPVAWKVRAGFTLKQHAPKAGPCYENFAELQDWNLQNDEATKDSIVFWIPRLLPGSTAKTVDEQKALLADLRQRYDLPATHLTSLGSAALLAGLILAHFKITGERVPLDRYWVRIDTLDSDGYLMRLGNFGGQGLGCDGYGWGSHRHGDLGCFALGV